VSIDPYDQKSQLRVLEALRRVPFDRLDSAVRMLEALSNDHHDPVTEGAPPLRPGRKPKSKFQNGEKK